jgi:glycosyltransferase involved in cell wall biosynthesis
MKKPTLSLCLIVRNEEGNLPRILQNAHLYADEIIITDTGSTDKTVKIAKKYTNKVSFFTPKTNPEAFFEDGMISDFAAARNFNFSQAKGKWILWLDADDSIVNPHLLKTLIEEAEIVQVSGFYFKYFYNFNEDGSVKEVQWRERLLKNDGHFEWKGRIHETPIQKRPVQWVRDERVYVIHHAKGERKIQSVQRNARILIDEAKKQGENCDPRILYYLGIAFMQLTQYKEALNTFEKYLEKSGWDEERYQAYQLMGEIYTNFQNYPMARRVYLKSLEEKPDYPDAYYNIASVYVQEENWNKAIEWLKIGFTKPYPQTNLITFPEAYTWRPAGTYAYCLLQLGRLDEAKEAIKKARSFNQKNKYLIDLENLINEVWRKREIAKNFVKIAGYLKDKGEENKILPLLGGVPKDLEDNPFILKIRFDYQKPRVWQDNEIAIYCGVTVEPWCPKSVKEGIGGSETAIIELAKRLQKLGWKVVVYNWCSTDRGIYDGVKYRNYWEFNIKDKFNVLVVWRKPEFFDLPIQAKMTILDMHDTMSIHDFTKERVDKIDRIFVKTKAHRRLYPEIPDEKFVIINNGIDLQNFKHKVKRDPHRLIYSSSPNRGLEIILNHWSRIRKEVPKANLHIFYGWKTFYELEKHNPERMAWMRKIREMMKQPGIKSHGRVGQRILAKEFMKSGIWSYPCIFYESSCISAMEAQAAGAIPVVINYAALQETVKGGVKIDGDGWDKETQERWLEALIDLLKHPDKQEVMRKELQKLAEQFSWDKVAEDWSGTIREFLKNKKSN